MRRRRLVAQLFPSYLIIVLLALLDRNGREFRPVKADPEDSAAAAFFNAIWRQMVARMFDAAADTELIHASGGDRYWTVIENIWDSLKKLGPTNILTLRNGPKVVKLWIR